MTMIKQDGAERPRLRIVDTSGPDFRSHDRTHVRRNKQAKSKQKQWPLEAMPIKRAVLEYGRRTAALGALQGAIALQSIAKMIRELGPQTTDIEKIAANAEKEAERLRSMIDRVYEDF
jgi:hypothetical protein